MLLLLTKVITKEKMNTCTYWHCPPYHSRPTLVRTDTVPHTTQDQHLYILTLSPIPHKTNTCTYWHHPPYHSRPRLIQEHLDSCMKTHHKRRGYKKICIGRGQLVSDICYNCLELQTWTVIMWCMISFKFLTSHHCWFCDYWPLVRVEAEPNLGTC